MKAKSLNDKISEGKSPKVLNVPTDLQGEYSQLVEQYAMNVARWIQAEELISETGFLAKHPTTGNATASPYISVSQTYMKQAQQV